MIHNRSQQQGFSLIEVMVVTSILAVITTTAAVALGKMFSISGQTREAARLTKTVRSGLFAVSAELRSSETVQCKPDELVYTHNGKPGEPHKPARQCTIRLTEAGLVKEVSRDELSSTELIVPGAVAFEVKCLTDKGWTSKPRGDIYVVSLSARIATPKGPGKEDVYTTSVSIPRAIWQGGAPFEEVENGV